MQVWMYLTAQRAACRGHDAQATHICVVDGDGAIVRRDVMASDPDVLARWLNKHCRDADGGLVRVVLETGPLSTFLCHGLIERGVPVICICARDAQAVRPADGERDNTEQAA